jgi:threonine dehydratase
MDANQVKTFLEEDHLKNIQRAAENLKPILLNTPLIRSDFFSEEYSCNVYLKPENLQRTGSFKIRGAYNKIANLTKEERNHGVISSSAGNHAQGVAYSAKEKGIPATIVMPNVTHCSKWMLRKLLAQR